MKRSCINVVSHTSQPARHRILVIAAALVLSGCSIVPGSNIESVALSPANPGSAAASKMPSGSNDGLSVQGSRSFRRSVYASTGMGASRLNPDNSQIPTWNVSDKVNAGGQITLGADVNRHVSLELHSADLGSAGVEKFGGTLRGRVNYHMHGGSVLWYLGKNRHRNKRQGITGFARAGVAMMDNSPVGNAPYSQRHSTQMLAGAGVEYASKIGLGVRAEMISFDSDAQYAQLGVVYRLGKKSIRKPVSVAQLPEEQDTPVVPIAAAAAAPLDTDNDGVFDQSDECQSTRRGVMVDAVGCAAFNEALEGVNFFSTSDRLTGKAKAILDDVAITLKKYPAVKINVTAHTDNVGTELYNQNLATRRAKTVVQYLGTQGIDKGNLIPLAVGESAPVATNDTPQGRAINRRVELQPIK